MVKVHRQLGEVFATWNRAGLTWCLLRMPAQPLAPTGDVDLLVDPAHVQAAHRILGRLGFERLPGWGYGSDAFFLRYDPHTDHWLWLHIASQLTFGPYQALRVGGEAECLARRRRVGRLRLLAPQDAFWTLLAHCLLDKQRLAVHHRRSLRGWAPAAVDLQGELAGALAPLCPAGWDPARLVSAVLARDWLALEGLAPSMVDACVRQRSLGWWDVLAIRASRLAARAGALAHVSLWRRYRSRRRRAWLGAPA